ncbi:acid protease [Fomes fomentarius]|nr:acid protease [Fomes fomentarius]
MLPLFLILSVLAFFDGCYAIAPAPRWRPDLRKKSPGLERNSRLRVRDVADGNATDVPPLSNSTIVPIAFASDKQMYYALSTVGDVSLRLALDTASADLWVVSSDCKTGACNLPKYPLSFESSTFVSVNSNSTPFDVHYADGTGAEGFVARESISIGNITVPNQAFGLAQDSNVTFSDQVSGVLGLGFPRLSFISNTVVNATPFLATLAQNGLIDYPLFGVSLTRDSSGSLTFGAIDGSVVLNRSAIEWNEVVPFAPFISESGHSASYLQWTVVLDSISVNGTALTLQPTYPEQTMNASLALIDVGTAGIFGPYQDVARIFSSISSARLVDDATGQYVVPCDTQDTIAFNFGGQDFILQPTDYIIGPASGNPNLCLAWPRANPPSSDGIDWQLGNPFLRTVYSIFNFGINSKEPPLIGFYPLSNATNLTETPESVSAFLASVSATVPTTLPNHLVSTPTLSTPTYTFNDSVTATPGTTVKSGLATSTYSALLASRHRNISAILTLTPSPTVATLILTDTSGHTHTSVSTASQRSITLGVPEGWLGNAAAPAYAASMGMGMGVQMQMTIMVCMTLGAFAHALL